MRRDFFVTGTDTGVGKTLVTAAVLRRLREAGHTVAGMKPVAAGASRGPAGPVNDDALLLQAESSARHPYAVVNPYLFEPPIAPHLAAAAAAVRIDFARIAAALARLRAAADVVLVEGAGGLLVPLDEQRSLAELPRLLGLEVILVVGLRLGCLNHALLTAEAARARGLALAGWVGNRIDPQFAYCEENIATLRALLPAPCLGIVPWQAAPSISATAAALTGAAALTDG
ncbi:MAG: dethiobiotin synthase [Gammaproteobacteria bacterium]|nr:dethiobiotin synthase [Gammaproteobacteria bacterium]